MTERLRCQDFCYMNSRRHPGFSKSPQFRRERQTLVTNIGLRKRCFWHDRPLQDLHRKATFIDSNDFSAFFDIVDIHTQQEERSGCTEEDGDCNLACEDPSLTDECES